MTFRKSRYTAHRYSYSCALHGDTESPWLCLLGAYYGAYYGALKWMYEGGCGLGF